MMTYDPAEKILFSADGFGKFGALDVEEDWACEARRYYFGIVGKYGAQVQTVLKKAAALEIEKILPLHGPMLEEDLGYYIGLYDTWSSYLPESDGICICYTSVYGHTKEAAELLQKELLDRGVPTVEISDLARCDMAEAVEDAFRYEKLVLATTTYNSEIFPFMKQFIDHLVERNYQKRSDHSDNTVCRIAVEKYGKSRAAENAGQIVHPFRLRRPCQHFIESASQLRSVRSFSAYLAGQTV